MKSRIAGKTRCIAVIALFTAAAGGILAGSPCAAQVTQRTINDYAAALERCRRTLIDAPGLRAPGEPLPAYISRITSPLPGESRTAYRNRIGSYIAVLEASTNATAPARTPPRLKRQDAANIELWRRASKDIGYLPRRMDHVRSAWASASRNPGAASAFSGEILQTLQIILDAFSRLRDARP